MLHQVSGGSSIRQHYYPALQRQWGNISGPYILQTDMCTSFAKGVADFNAFMGREAIRLLFRGRGQQCTLARFSFFSYACGAISYATHSFSPDFLPDFLGELRKPPA